MSDMLDRADSSAVSTSGDDSDRGAEIRRRFDALGISEREWHTKTGIDRKTLHRAIENQPATRSSTYAAIESNLDKLEALAAGQPVAMPALAPHLIRVEVQGVYGAKALIIEGDSTDTAALEAMVDRIMRNLRESTDNDS
jgi:hypothetical protein